MNSKILNLRANGIDFHCLDAGEGPLVLALHGFPDEATTWRHQIPALVEAGYRVVAPYMRGYTPSSAPADGRYEIASLGRDALGLIEALGVEKATLLGHDWGGLATYSAAVQDSSRIERIATVAMPYSMRMLMAYLNNVDQMKRSWYIFFFQLEIADMAVAEGDFALIERIWREWSPDWEAPSEVMASVKATLAKPGVLEAALGYYRSVFQADRQDPALAEASAMLGTAPVSVPALVLHGANDGCMGAELFEGCEELCVGGCETVCFEGAGHFLHQEKPEEFNRALLDWLGR